MADDVKKINGCRFIPQGTIPAEVERYKQDLLAEVSRGVGKVLADGRPYLVRFRWDDVREIVASAATRVIRLDATLALQTEAAAATSSLP
jgi:hypothetical protein